MVDFGFRQGTSEFSTAGIERAISRIENERERRRGPKDAVYGWTLNKGVALIGATIIRSNLWWHPMKTLFLLRCLCNVRVSILRFNSKKWGQTFLVSVQGSGFLNPDSVTVYKKKWKNNETKSYCDSMQLH